MIQNTDAIDRGRAIPKAEERAGDQGDIVVPVIAERAEVTKVEEHIGTRRVRKHSAGRGRR